MRFKTFSVQNEDGTRWLVVENCKTYEGSSREDALDELGLCIMQEELDHGKL